jgi:predicted O-methyltransferase YrrM
MIKILSNIRTKHRNRTQLSRLRKATLSVARPIADALCAFLDQDLSYQDSCCIERIEALRGRLERSSDKLSFIDYGTGTPTENRSETEMYHGKTVTLSVGEACAASKPPEWCLLLYLLVQRLRPSMCLELGSNLGISTAYLLAPLQLNKNARLISLEGSKSKAELAIANLSDLGFEQFEVVVGRFQDTLDEVLLKVKNISFAFIDGHHDENATIGYFRRIKQVAARGAVIVFDDIAWSSGMRNAWARICEDVDAALAVDFGSMGLIVIEKNVLAKLSLRLLV